MAELGGSDVDGLQKRTSTLVDGSKLIGVVKIISRDPNSRWKYRRISRFAINASEIAKVTIQSDRIRYLVRHRTNSISKNKPSSPQLGQWKRDTSLLGNPIRLKYQLEQPDNWSSQKGIGTRSYTSIVFSNDK